MEYVQKEMEAAHVVRLAKLTHKTNPFHSSHSGYDQVLSFNTLRDTLQAPQNYLHRHPLTTSDSLWTDVSVW